MSINGCEVSFKTVTSRLRVAPLLLSPSRETRKKTAKKNGRARSWGEKHAKKIRQQKGLGVKGRMDSLHYQEWVGKSSAKSFLDCFYHCVVVTVEASNEADGSNVKKIRQILQFCGKKGKYHHVSASLRSWQFRFHDDKNSWRERLVMIRVLV